MGDSKNNHKKCLFYQVDYYRKSTTGIGWASGKLFLVVLLYKEWKSIFTDIRYC
ncbi:hypothetical protein [Segetibacter aerophilus]|uniref:hypothetical protein n=1 Tax=Segetibacter aerophilus TaxID=670293 RepID=UPI001479026E|nr:hypothetical protein [Segetibacter aerophilus]